MADSPREERGDSAPNAANAAGALYAYRKNGQEQEAVSHAQFGHYIECTQEEDSAWQETSTLLAGLEQAMPGPVSHAAPSPLQGPSPHPGPSPQPPEALTLHCRIGQGEGVEAGAGASEVAAQAQGGGVGTEARAHETAPQAQGEGAGRVACAHGMEPQAQGGGTGAMSRAEPLGVEAQWGGGQDWAADPEGGAQGVHHAPGEGARERAGVEENGEGEGGGRGEGSLARLFRQSRYSDPLLPGNRSLPEGSEARVQALQMGQGAPVTWTKEYTGVRAPGTLTKEHSWPLACRGEAGMAMARGSMSSRDFALLQAVEDQQDCRSAPTAHQFQARGVQSGDQESCRGGVPGACRFQASGSHSGGRRGELYPRFQDSPRVAGERNAGASDSYVDGSTSVMGGEGPSQGSCATAGALEPLLILREGSAQGEMGRAGDHLEAGQMETWPAGQVGSSAAGQMEYSRAQDSDLASLRQMRMRELRQQREAQLQDGQAMLQELTSPHSDAGTLGFWLGPGAGRLERCASGVPMASTDGGQRGVGGARGSGSAVLTPLEIRGVSSARAELIRRWQRQHLGGQQHPQQQPQPQQQQQPQQQPQPQQQSQFQRQQQPLQPQQPQQQPQLQQQQQEFGRNQQQQYQQQLHPALAPTQLPTTQRPRPKTSDNPADARSLGMSTTESPVNALGISAVQRTGVGAGSSLGVPEGTPQASQAPGGVELELIEHLSLVKPEPGSLGEALLSSTRLALPPRGAVGALPVPAPESRPRPSFDRLALPAPVLNSSSSPSPRLRTQAAGMRLLNEQAPPGGTGAQPSLQAQGAAPGMPQRGKVALEVKGSSEDSMELEGAHEGGAHPGSPAGPKGVEAELPTECRGQGRQKRIVRERERRSKVRVQLKRLRSLLPRELADEAALDTVSLISTAVDYIKHLQSSADQPETG